ncbi:MAG: hypothetical protein IJA31_08115 [Clostridia bacterium]|nr:hypothetical protein [Clostridia bacterium]
MYITFKNNSTSEKMHITVEDKKYVINPASAVDVFCRNEKLTFVAETSAFSELIQAAEETDESGECSRFKDKLLAKLSKKVAEKLPQAVLNISVHYEITCNGLQNTVVELQEGMYAVCDGKLADFLDLAPVVYVFARAETAGGQITVREADAVNRKQYLKLMRNLLLFLNWGTFFIDLFLFIPEYFSIRFFATHFYIKQLLTGLYKKTAPERARILSEKAEHAEQKEKKKGCLPSLVKGLLVLLIIGGICWWGITSEPEVLIAEDFSRVVCFDETFIKIDGGLPSDAEKTFLENYDAFYPLADGEYDMDNYDCYIYETPDGTRYMWLKANCTDPQNEKKDYADYENPLVYQSVGETQ